ncbi:MAG: hypothetical protein HZA90_26030 [Verrucomicrobia bacterium]|nr:hypothetical protein [Verrucomicrobiota bacterium]
MSDFSSLDWNFDNVPDDELVGCCYWEYARESAFIRDVKRRCEGPQSRELRMKELWEYCGDDVERIQSIGYPAEVFLRGFFFDRIEDRKPKHPKAQPITGRFPCPWQSLSEVERKERSRIRTDRGTIPLVPFERGQACFAEWIAEYCQTQRTEAFRRQEEVKGKHPGIRSEELWSAGKLESPDVRPSLFTAGAEVGVFKIEWTAFTNEELYDGFHRWIRQNRPRGLRSPDGRGHKPRDRRAALDRLGMMRLLHRFTLREMQEKCVEACKAFGGYEWYKERKRALQTFHKLLPFLSSSERPLAWPTKGGRSK